MFDRKFFALLLPLLAIHQDAKLTVTPLRAGGIYELGERAGWTVTGDGSEKLTYSLKKNNLVVIETGEIDVSKGSVMIVAKVNEPAMLYLEIRSPESRRPMAFGAAIEPTKLKPVHPRPRDFDAFWKAKVDGLKKIPENAVITPGESYKPEVEYSTVQMDGADGGHVYGQLARPKTAGKHPAMLVLQWASPPYPLQKSWVIEPAAKGWLVLNIEPHDVLPTAPPEYYRTLPAELKNYPAIGRDDREKSYFVQMYLRDYRGVDFLTHQPDWDGKVLVVTGTSMGGQQSLCVAGLHPKVTHVIVNEPAGCDLNASLHGRQMGYPNFPANDPKTMAVAPYVDAINFASRIRARSMVAMGFVDTVAPPAGIWTAFNQIKGPKEAVPMFDSPHNNTATPAQQRPWSVRSAAWMDALVSGRPIEPPR